jgi:hypothetical protein
VIDKGHHSLYTASGAIIASEMKQGQLKSFIQINRLFRKYIPSSNPFSPGTGRGNLQKTVAL